MLWQLGAAHAPSRLYATINASDDMDAIKRGPRASRTSCRPATPRLWRVTLIQGHVPAGDVKKLLAERPTAAPQGVS